MKAVAYTAFSHIFVHIFECTLLSHTIQNLGFKGLRHVRVLIGTSLYSEQAEGLIGMAHIHSSKGWADWLGLVGLPDWVGLL